MGCQQSKIKPATPAHLRNGAGARAPTSAVVCDTATNVSQSGARRSNSSSMQQRAKVVTIVEDPVAQRRAASPDAAVPADGGNLHGIGACPALRARLASRSKSSSLEGQEPTVFQISESRSIEKMYRRWSRKQLMEQQRAEAAQVVASIARFEALLSQQQPSSDDDDTNDDSRSADNKNHDGMRGSGGEGAEAALASVEQVSHCSLPQPTLRAETGKVAIASVSSPLVASMTAQGDANSNEEDAATCDVGGGVDAATCDVGGGVDAAAIVGACTTQPPPQQIPLSDASTGASSPLQLRTSSNSNAALRSHSSGSLNLSALPKSLSDSAVVCSVENQENAVMVGKSLAKAAPDGLQHAASPNRCVSFDAVAMRQSAPRTAQPLTRKQSSNRSGSNTKQRGKKPRTANNNSKPSIGRSGPVASKWDKGGKAHMQTDIYMDMAAAFERMLTNADTINAQLDSR